MEPTKIQHTVPAGAGKTYTRIAFEVPENTEYLKLSGSYKTESIGRVDIGLEDAEGQIRGWSGKLQLTRPILLAEEQASYGYLAGALQPGTWHILLGDRQAHSQPIDVKLELQLEPQQKRIVRGDIHGHSYYSDGSHSIEEKLAMAQEQGLDFLGFTDHNSVAQNKNLPSNPDVLLLPSCEITSYNGHVNIFGYHKQSIPNFMFSESAEVRSQLEQLKNQGVWLQLNHPIRKGDLVGCQWNWSYDMPFDWIEVWNGAWSENCIANLKLWQSFLEAGRFLPAVGNSDFHQSGCKIQGHPCNNVLVGKKTAAEIFSALAKGHNYLTASPSNKKSFSANCYSKASEAHIPFGSTLETTDQALRLLRLEIETDPDYLKDLTASGKLLLRIWNESGLDQERKLSLGDFSEQTTELGTRAHYKLELGLEKQGQKQTEEQKSPFLRFELLHAENQGKAPAEKMLLLTNPIFAKS